MGTFGQQPSYIHTRDPNYRNLALFLQCTQPLPYSATLLARGSGKIPILVNAVTRFDYAEVIVGTSAELASRTINSPRPGASPTNLAICEQPSALAICAWDGELTYAQLDQLSSKLAHKLVDLGVTSGSMILLCFEKTMWMPVAILAVMKAGAVSIPLDTTQPEERLRLITAQISSPIILTSSTNGPLVGRLNFAKVVMVDKDLLSETAMDSKHQSKQLMATSSTLLCVIYSSGTSEIPRGTLYTHQNFSSAIVYQQKTLGFSSSSRVLDFAPYTSWLAWYNLLQTLTCGGCLCIASDSSGMGVIQESMSLLRVDFVCVTPSLSQMLDFSEISGSIHLAYIGDFGYPVRSTMKNATNTHLISEVVGGCASGTCIWVVGSNDFNRLVPVGTVGELCLEGPLVSPGYFHDSAETAVDFIEDPPWLLRRSPGQHGRHGVVQRTGDLVRYQDNGALVFVGRKETQDESDDGSTLLNEEGKLCARVLNVSQDFISIGDNFFDIGGDCSAALRLARLARSEGLNLTVRSVFQSPILRDLSIFLGSSNTSASNPVPPFSLLKAIINENDVTNHAARLCGVQASQVMDVLPCTPLQEGLLALTAKTSRAYVATNVFQLRQDVDIERLQHAWDQVATMNDILRTRIVSLPQHGMAQVVLEQGLTWSFGANLETHLQEQNERIMGLGTSLTTLAVTEADSKGHRYLVWEIHHALYDGWSIQLLLSDVECVYCNEPGQNLESMANFIRHIIDYDESAMRRFWQSQFANTQGTHFPLIKTSSYQPRPDCQINTSITDLNWGNSDYTAATMIRAAWAVVAAQSTGSNEALFGVTITGRQAPVERIEMMAGPAIATVPVRVALNWEESVHELLHAIQNQVVEMIPYEQTGLQKIRRINESTALACNFQTLLVVQPAAQGEDLPSRLFVSEPVDDSAASDQWKNFSTYAIVLECQLESDGVRMRVAFDSNAISQQQIQRTVRNFEHVLHQLSDVRRDKERLKIAVGVNQWGLEDIWSWNAKVPEPMNACAHDLIMQRVFEDSLAPAIHAWDGELTYGELDQLSTTLAYRLVEKGVGPGITVPLCFEKSMWMPVAAYAVMKAGGACVALDTTQPEDRLRTIANQVGPLAVLSSASNEDMAHRLGDSEVVVVGGKQSAGLSAPMFSALEQHQKLSPVSPSDVLYVVFTSGSTGTPKGAIVTHQNFCSAVKYQQQPLSFSRNSRVFDFASYAFDAAWCNLLHALTAGGCPCIPSTDERQNHLPECLEKYNTTTADFTPSVARFIGPKSLSRLSTLILGGEAVLPKVRADEAIVTIGRGAGVCTWVVDIDNPDELAPIGRVGELWAEGLLVGQGYLKNLEKTATAFVENPSWLLRGATGHPGRRARLYRTGDLVKYREDGVLVYVGRKDTQVKIRGQRVELGEIEHHIQRTIESSAGNMGNVQVVVETIKPTGINAPILVAFVALEHVDGMTEELYHSAVRQATSGLSDRLADSIPVYMVPSAYIPIQAIPMAATGKADRRKLRTMGESQWLQYQDTSDDNQPVETLSEMENILRSVWMSVLNLSITETPVTKSFMRLGGDSITAMQVVSQCRLHNVALTASDVLQAGTIRKLAARCQIISRQTALTVVDSEDNEDEVNSQFELSPIQQMFFDSYPEGLNHFNQSFMLELSQTVSTEALRNAIQAIVSRHAMLRARFQKDPHNGIWSQSVAADHSDSFVFAEHFISQISGVWKPSQWRQENLDLQKGPVFACDFFHKWTRLQAKTARTTSPLSVLPFPISQPEIEFWGLPLAENTFSDCEGYSDGFDAEVTSLIFGDCNDSLRSDPIDILVGALVHSFLHVFPERSVPAIWLEGHGREQSDDLPVDVSGTVGWFTTVYPLPIPITPESTILEAIRLAKDIRRQVPGKGRPYFACRYHSESGREAFQGHEVAEILFNFTGRYQQLEKEESLLRRVEETDEGTVIQEVSPLSHRSTMIEVNGDVEDGELAISFQFHQKSQHQTRLKQWCQKFFDTVRAATHDLTHAPASFTRSDLPLLSLSYRGLDVLLREQIPSLGIECDAIADIYPCTPLQEGILLSSLKGAASYATYSVWKCVPLEGCSSVISPSQLEAAWKKVVRRHTILSTVFTSHPEGDGFMQIVIPGSEIRVTHMITEQDSPSEILCQLDKPTFGPNEPEHAFTICQSQAGEVACRLDMSHALMDGSSMSILVQEIIAAYDGLKLPAPPTFSKMIEYISSLSKAYKTASWIALLDGIKPCEFPIISPAPGSMPDVKHGEISLPANLTPGMVNLCRSMGITRSAFLQVAWVMVLSHFTGMKEACFGYLASGRDAPIEGLENMVGPLANMLISRIDLRTSPRHVLATTMEKSIKHMAIQHASLAEIQHQLGLSGKPLFNTSLSIREADKFSAGENVAISFELHDGDDPHEYDLGLSAKIDGDSIDITVEFREPNISAQAAQEACEILVMAIEYLLKAADADQSNMGNVGQHLVTESLHGGFFKHIVGADETETTAFWQTHFENIQGSHFPAVKAVSYRPQPQNKTSLILQGLDWSNTNYMPFTIVRAAWSLVASRMTDSSEALFGATVIREKMGHAALSDYGVVPVRVLIDKSSSINKLLQQVEDQAMEMTSFQQIGLQSIRSIGEEASIGCDFQTLLVIQSSSEAVDLSSKFGSHAMVVRCQVETDGLRIRIDYDDNMIGELDMIRVACQFEGVVHQLVNLIHKTTVGDIAVVSGQDLADIWTWNANVPQSADACVHDLIKQRVREQPRALAIDAWDGNLTYKQLDQYAADLARRLLGKGVRRGMIVLLFFEKSMWMPVTALAVMKAGAASVAVDVTQPEDRLRMIVSQAGPCLLLSSKANADLARRVGGEKVMIVDRHQSQGPAHIFRHRNRLPKVSPSDVLYVVFTSGSTGTPKGTVLTHRNLCSAITHQRDALGYTPQSRVFDFASYAFDVAWSNLINTLTVGGCLCIPSAAERQNNLSGCLEKYQINLADFTPSVSRHIEPGVLKSLSTLLLGGEVVLPSDAVLAGEQTRVIGAYGPAECTPTSTLIDLTISTEGIGRASGLCTWIVDVDNPNMLAPIGATGELWLEGPLVGQGYLNDANKTAAAFVQDPSWLLLGDPHSGRRGRRGRLYRTGDLVRYREDGSLVFIGRKDTQVKIRGQRVELGEVELHVGRALETARGKRDMQIIAETIQPQGASSKILVAFITLNDAGSMTDDEHDSAVRKMTAGLMEHLTKLIPIYMVPSAFIPIKKVPMTATGKIDRRRLGNIGSSFTMQQIAELSRSEGERRPPQSNTEELIQSLWAEILQIDPNNIGIDDSFFRIGGDSIGAMRLVGLARQKGLVLSVGDIFRYPVLGDISSFVDK
ncbi:Nonribosomal peptide synthetase dtxS1 [Cladobotryum mycophilum]|uniref:Nonribosomal peptide synthetase dtxS1 n=1 Tax=Cladobotryum mycophilum TaxID=491253 RepID=A0ABR0S9D9_9HYPO